MKKRIAAAYRYSRAIWIGLAIALAVLLVSSVSVDLGPALKARAERAGSNWLDRPMHIGRLGVQIARGRFVVEDLRVEGLTPGDDPWLVAERVEVSLTWGAILHREVLLDTIEMDNWRMVVESYPNGRHSFPRVNGPPRPPSTGERPVVTTLASIHASNGEFVLRDFGSDWGVVAPNLDVVVSKLGEYRGTASFSNGTVTVQDFLPMAAEMTSSFTIQGGDVVFDRIDLVTDGAVSALTGRVDLARWPEQTYQIRSRVQFPRMREIFFADDEFDLHGQGDFIGTFHLFKGGREVKGRFASPEAGLNSFRFPNLEGELVWLTDRFDVTRASADFYEGRTDFTYSMAPLGDPGRRAHAAFNVNYRDVDLATLMTAMEMPGLTLAGLATGTNRLEWPMGAFGNREGDGTVLVAPPPGTVPLGPTLPADAADQARGRALSVGPFSNHRPRGPVGIAAELTYAFDGEAVRLEPGVFATEHTFVTFEGATAWGERSKLPFRVTSRDWQEADRLLAGIMTAFGNDTDAIPIDGIGRFDGVMLGAFRRPRIEGRFVGSEMRAWGVTWGDVDGDFVVDNNYTNVSRAVVRAGASRMDVSGQFSIGYPRSDGGEEIDARVAVEGRPMADFLNAFDLEDYDIDGVVSGDFHLYGQYTRPHGFGRLDIDKGIAYGEPFDEATSALRFEGDGVRVDGINVLKGGTTVTGAAYVGWNGSYSFNADGRGMAVDALKVTSMESGPGFTGLLDFAANGSGTFDEPRYDVKLGVRDLFFGEEGVGEVSGRLSVRNTVMTYEVEVASTRLAASGTGRIALTDQMDAELTFRVSDTSLDPYLRAFQPELSPYTSAVASGSVRVVGELYNPDALRVDTVVDQMDLQFFDYRLANAEPIRLSVDRQVLHVDSLRLVGEDTELDMAGTVDLPKQALALSASGAANLAVLQGFVPDLRSTGRAEVSARITGTADAPIVTGNALVANGRLRHFAFPHALEALNGIVTYNATGIRLDGVSGRLANGPVRFGGRLGLSGYRLSEYDVTASATDMRLRFPEGMRSVVDADLALQGPVSAPVVSGLVTIKSAAWSQPFDTSTGLFDLAPSTSSLPAVEGAVSQDPIDALRYDVRIISASTIRIENDQTRIVVSADVNLRGTMAAPSLIGRADVQRGEVTFEGRRYLLTRGSLDFNNPNRIQPFFDVEAETRVRVPDQTYRVTLRMAGTTERLRPEFTSDPPLPPLDILTMLFSDSAPAGDFEVAALQNPNERERRLLEARATRALTGTLSAEVGRVVQETFGVDTFQITPLLVDPSQQSAQLTVNPSARITIGKRISDRIYLTYARSLSSSTRDEIILLEYDQSESLAWVLSQNEDRTYALEVRKRHTF